MLNMIYLHTDTWLAYDNQIMLILDYLFIKFIAGNNAPQSMSVGSEGEQVEFCWSIEDAADIAMDLCLNWISKKQWMNYNEIQIQW